MRDLLHEKILARNKNQENFIATSFSSWIKLIFAFYRALAQFFGWSIGLSLPTDWNEKFTEKIPKTIEMVMDCLHVPGSFNVPGVVNELLYFLKKELIIFYG